MKSNEIPVCKWPTLQYNVWLFTFSCTSVQKHFRKRQECQAGGALAVVLHAGLHINAAIPVCKFYPCSAMSGFS
jgi:hypothetical protein